LWKLGRTYGAACSGDPLTSETGKRLDVREDVLVHYVCDLGCRVNSLHRILEEDFPQSLSTILQRLQIY
jgi:hypothetical protein